MENKRIEYIFNVLLNIWIKYDIEDMEKLKGISEIEYSSLQNLHGKDFPYAISIYLNKFAGETLNIFSNISNTYTGIMEARNTANNLLNHYNKEIPKNSFVFGQRFGCTFFYFVDNETNNPEIYIMNEELNDSNEYELINVSMGCFTDWIINQTISGLLTCKDIKIEELKTIKLMLENIRDSTDGI
ncbi:MAG: hypothetical protein LBU85_03190 [Treponema sp.]|jgi:hypothetical protein|nr:hypothetical protein [Treponema sp.]